MPFRDVNNMWKETSRVCDDAGVINVPPSRIVIVKSTEFQAFDIFVPQVSWGVGIQLLMSPCRRDLPTKPEIDEGKIPSFPQEIFTSDEGLEPQ